MARARKRSSKSVENVANTATEETKIEETREVDEAQSEVATGEETEQIKELTKQIQDQKESGEPREVETVEVEVVSGEEGKQVEGSSSQQDSQENSEITKVESQALASNQEDDNDKSQNRTPLTEEERKRFEELDGKVEDFVKSTFILGRILKEISDEKLYREDFDSFEMYLKNKFDIARSRAYQLMNASEVYEYLEKGGVEVLPNSEFQVRALIPYRNPSKYPDELERESLIVNRWNKAVEESEREVPTEQEVRKVCVQLDNEGLLASEFSPNDLVIIKKVEGSEKLQGQGNYRGIVTEVGNFGVTIKTARGSFENIHPQFIEKITVEEKGKKKLNDIRNLIEELSLIWKLNEEKDKNPVVRSVVRALADREEKSAIDTAILNTIKRKLEKEERKIEKTSSEEEEDG